MGDQASALLTLNHCRARLCSKGELFASKVSHKAFTYQLKG